MELDVAEKAVLFFHDPGSEINCVADNVQSPELLHPQRGPVRFRHRPEKSAGADVVTVDLAVAEIADEQGARQVSELPVRRKRQAPGRVERAARGEALDEVAVCIKDADETVAWTRDIVVRVTVLLGVGDVDETVDVPDPEKRVAARNTGIRNPGAWRSVRFS